MGARKKYDRELIVSLHNQGVKHKEIAETVGCSFDTLCNILQEERNKGEMEILNKKPKKYLPVKSFSDEWNKACRNVLVGLRRAAIRR